MREIGEVTRAGGAFRAELRSMAHRLGQPQGRVYGRRCDATLGDGRCGVDLARFTG
ncbi:baseplate hub protein, partial [Rhizobium sp. BR5]